MIDIIITCKDRLPHLRKCYESFNNTIKNNININIIIVAYGDLLAHNFGKKIGKSIYVNEKGFHLSRARNIGANQSNAEWLFFCDADTLFDPNFFIELNLESGNFYTGEPHCSGNCIVKRSDFMGYDENIIGYGGEDADLYISLERNKIVKKQLLNFKYIMHTDFDRTRNYKGDKKWDQQKRNIMYLMSKHPHEYLFPKYIPNEMKSLFI
jgi:glycosyltransferase involved in cell wall biosynthesis